MKNLLGAAFSILAFSGCDFEPYLRDETNLYVLGIFVVLAIIILGLAMSLGQPTAAVQKATAVRQERNWMEELAELRSAYIRTQQNVIEHCLGMMSDRQKQDAELKRLRLKSDSAMAKVIRLQEEMLKAGVNPAKVGMMDEDEEL